MAQIKILLAQLNSNGDCLYATVIAKQIKEVDYPECHLTWAVNSYCRQSVLFNPYVDEIWEIATNKSITSEDEWNDFRDAFNDLNEVIRKCLEYSKSVISTRDYKGQSLAFIKAYTDNYNEINETKKEKERIDSNLKDKKPVTEGETATKSTQDGKSFFGKIFD